MKTQMFKYSTLILRKRRPLDRRKPRLRLALFFPTLWAVNIQWHEKPERRVDSYAVPKGRWR